MAAPSIAALPESKTEILDPTKQNTLKRSIRFAGIGLFTAEAVTLTIHPASPNTGLVFQRSDLPGKPTMKAELDRVVDTPRCTVLGCEEFTIHTVEHLLSALHSLEIDNAILELTGPEIPILDGSSMGFVEAMCEEIVQLDQAKETHFLRSSVSWSNGKTHLVAIPAESLSVSYTMHFPQSKILGSQYYETQVTPELFAENIAPCRTFCLYEEIAPFLESGMIKGGGLDNAVIIKNDVVINPEGIRFSDEMVRHKILDLIGDLALIPGRFCAHIIAICSGHASNVAFAQELYKQIKLEKKEGHGASF